MSPRPLPVPPAVMGILNVTPDSFSDGGRFEDPGAAVARGLEMAEEGALFVDIGAESTRPGATPVDPSEERRRLLPVLRGLRARTGVLLSVDTRNASTAAAAIDEGADVVNDVSMLRHDPLMARAVAGRAALVLVHSRGAPRTMQQEPRYGDVALEVVRELRGGLELALQAGCDPAAVVVDPGFGFAKTADHNLALLAGLERLAEIAPVLVGLSRKTVLGQVLAHDGRPRPVDERGPASVAAALAAWLHGASYFRVHDVRPTVDALTVFRAAVPGAGRQRTSPRP